jgi:hypothetical protein
MTPSLLYALLAVFAACTGYAAGRLHQWHRLDADREEAYREGYDDAARRTFTMAARVAGRRERPSAQASATVFHAAPADASPDFGATAVPPAAGPAAAPAGSPSGFPVPSSPFPAPVRPTLFPPVDRPPAASPDAEGEGGEPSAPPRRRPRSGRITGRLPRRGRHLVPQELVRAATYRLNPDRVARAKVRGALPPPGDEAAGPAGPVGQDGPAGQDGPGEARSEPAVPKPRSS